MRAPNTLLLIRFLLCFLLIVPAGTGAYAQSGENPAAGNTGTVVTFRFLAGQDMFYAACGGNETELSRLYRLVDEYRTEIVSETMPVYVDGYCASLPTERENRRMAFVRSNRVKSELITRKGLAEENFVTKNHTSDYNGHKDVVVVTIHIPVLKEEEQRQEPEAEQVIKPEPVREETGKETEDESVTIEGQSQEPAIEEQQTVLLATDTPQTPESKQPRYIALKTNLAAWVGTVLNASFEAQVGSRFSIDFPVMWCPWHIGDRRSVRTFALQPEARYWLSRPGEGHFFGLHAHAAWFNVRWKDDRYQDTGRPLLGAGLSYGYLLPLGGRWSGEFTLGAGYANMRYDTYYNIDNGARIDTRTKNYWGITRVGVSLVYRFNTNK